MCKCCLAGCTTTCLSLHVNVCSFLLRLTSYSFFAFFILRLKLLQRMLRASLPCWLIAAPPILCINPPSLHARTIDRHDNQLVRTHSLWHHTAGTDAKSILLNLSSLLVFLAPFVWYFFTEHMVPYAVGTFLCYAVAFLLPPTGWRRPHPYSDDPTNVPYGSKQK